MTSDGTRIQILADWPRSHAKRVTRDNRKNPENTQTVPQENHGQTMLKNEQHIGSEKTYGPKIYWTVKHNDAKDR